jgi:hypothetical protein
MYCIIQYKCYYNYINNANGVMKMNKVQMIDAIILTAKNAAMASEKVVDLGDMFFALAFRTDKELKKICKQLRIAV